jgi:transposase-like protein
MFRNREEIEQRIVARVRTGETIKAAARACGVSYSTLHRWRQGDGKLRNLDAVACAARFEREEQYRRAVPRPLPIRSDCPGCGRGAVRGRKALSFLAF